MLKFCQNQLVLCSWIYIEVACLLLDSEPGFSVFSFPLSGAPNGNFRENICSEDDLRPRIFGAFIVKFLACLPLLGFSNIYKMV